MTHNQFDIFKDIIEPIKKLIDSYNRKCTLDYEIKLSNYGKSNIENKIL